MLWESTPTTWATCTAPKGIQPPPQAERLDAVLFKAGHRLPQIFPEHFCSQTFPFLGMWQGSADVPNLGSFCP